MTRLPGEVFERLGLVMIRDDAISDTAVKKVSSVNYQLLANLEKLLLGQQIVGQQDLIHKLMLALLATGTCWWRVHRIGQNPRNQRDGRGYRGQLPPHSIYA